MKAKATKRSSSKRPTTDEQQFILDLVQLKVRAGALGLYRTMHALEKPQQIVGWEVAAKISQSPKSKADALKKAEQADALGLKTYARELRRESRVGTLYRGPGR